LTPESEAMANKTLHEFSDPTTTNIHTRPHTDVGENGFELKPALINMVKASQFCGKAHEDASATSSYSGYFHYQRSNQRCYSALPFSILTIGKGKSSGSTPIKTRTLHGISAPLPS
jgi:hypothetical protein